METVPYIIIILYNNYNIVVLRVISIESLYSKGLFGIVCRNKMGSNSSEVRTVQV